MPDAIDTQRPTAPAACHSVTGQEPHLGRIAPPVRYAPPSLSLSVWVPLAAPITKIIIVSQPIAA
jgi:hypothetical protein